MILFVNDLTVIDFSYLDAKRGAVGESWIVDLTLHGALNEESMVLDFAKVKKQVKRIIDDTLDHTLAIPTKAAIRVKQDEERITASYEFEGKHLAVSGPEQGFCLMDCEQVDIDSATSFLIATIAPHLPDNVEKLEIALRPERTDGFYYHYSHGLKKHDGNCQRIVHGHRSTIAMYKNGLKTPRLEKLWADRWADIYLGSEEDLVAQSALKYIKAQPESHHFAYEASQGYYELSISKAVCEIIPTDTTVELLADYLAAQTKLMEGDADIKAVAYEGVGKGAISYA